MVLSKYKSVLRCCESLCAVAKQLFFSTTNQFWTIVCSCEAVKVIGDHSSESNARLATGIPAKTLPHRSPLVTHGSRPMRAQCWASLRSHWSSLTPLPRAVITWLEDTCCVSLWVRIRSRHLASFTTSEPLSKLSQNCGLHHFWASFGCPKVVSNCGLHHFCSSFSCVCCVAKGKTSPIRQRGSVVVFAKVNPLFLLFFSKNIFCLFFSCRGGIHDYLEEYHFSHNTMKCTYVVCCTYVVWVLCVGRLRLRPIN